MRTASGQLNVGANEAQMALINSPSGAGNSSSGHHQAEAARETVEETNSTMKGRKPLPIVLGEQSGSQSGGKCSYPARSAEALLQPVKCPVSAVAL